MIVIGDMQIIPHNDGTRPPLNLIKALGVIALQMHQEFSDPKYDLAHPDKSKESCILSSLTVRDFLKRAGFRARVSPVQTFIVADKAGERLHSLGLGTREAPDRGGWSGHLVVIVGRWLIDTTLYQTIRPAWPDLPGMMVVPIDRTIDNIFNLRGLSILQITEPATDYACTIAWADDPTNTNWSSAPDARCKERRAGVVQHLLKTYKQQDKERSN